MTNYRECILTKLNSTIPTNEIQKNWLAKLVDFTKTTTDEIKLRQLWLKVCKPFSRQLDINGGEAILEPAKPKEMTMEQIKAAFDSPR